MRKLMITVCAVCVLFSAMAQNENYQSTISVNAGLSVLGTTFNLLEDANIEGVSIINNVGELESLSGQLNGQATPALELNYDYGLTKWFSIGGGLAYQKVSAELMDLSYTETASGEMVALESANLKINRTHLGVRALFHYGNSNRMDLYSGFRLGLTNWGTKVEATDPRFEENLKESNIFGFAPSIQIIPFALRGYVTEQIGISFETGIGTPHFFAFGINYRM